MKYQPKPITTVDAFPIISTQANPNPDGSYNLILGNNKHQVASKASLVDGKRPARMDYWVVTAAGNGQVMAKADFEAKYAVMR